MPSKRPVLRWSTLPPEQQATEVFLAMTGRAARSPYLRKYIRALRRPNGCQAAGRMWRLFGRYLRCTNTAAPGEHYCGQHGGLVRGTVRSTVPSQFAPKPPEGA